MRTLAAAAVDDGVGDRVGATVGRAVGRAVGDGAAVGVGPGLGAHVPVEAGAVGRAGVEDEAPADVEDGIEVGAGEQALEGGGVAVGGAPVQATSAAIMRAAAIPRTDRPAA